jgi:hypothetical protein
VSRLDLAHITDVHLGPLPQARVRELLGKRAFGYVSWHRRRHRVHRVEVLDALAGDLEADLPDHIVVTGDLVNIALPPEFEQAARWLEATATPDRLTLVPGNHDAYAGKSYRAGWSRWHAYMQGDGGALAGHFPFVREISPRLPLSVSPVRCRVAWALPRASSARPRSRPWTGSWANSALVASAVFFSSTIRPWVP